MFDVDFEAFTSGKHCFLDIPCHFTIFTKETISSQVWKTVSKCTDLVEPAFTANKCIIVFDLLFHVFARISPVHNNPVLGLMMNPVCDCEHMDIYTD